MSKCFVCGGSFVPSKFTPSQKCCSTPCREKVRAAYKRAYDARWRERHPGYMKNYQKQYSTEAVS